MDASLIQLIGSSIAITGLAISGVGSFKRLEEAKVDAADAKAFEECLRNRGELCTLKGVAFTIVYSDLPDE